MKGEWTCTRCGYKIRGDEQEVLMKVIDHEADYHPETFKEMLQALANMNSGMNYPTNASPN